MGRVEKVAFDGFEWDEVKRRLVLKLREIDFVQVAEALLQPHLSQSSNKDGEARTLVICSIDGRLVRAVYTSRDDICRIITAMAARRNEREKYRQIFGG